MKAEMIDYRGFRLSRLNEPRFKHVKLLGGWIFYFSMYFITENLIPASKCHPIHCALDDLIPFNEFFVIFYVFWYALVFGSLLYYFLYDRDKFSKLQTYIIITQVVAMACYCIYPSRQDLRPAVFERENFLTAVIAFIYSFDTPTGVCPSLHVGYSVGIASAALKDRELPAAWKIGAVIFTLLVCCAVCFVKQHSFVDVVAAIPLCLLAEVLVYGKNYWLPRLKGRR